MFFDINKYKGRYAMHCKTEEEARDFCNYLHSIGKCWCSGEKFTAHTNFCVHKHNTVYFFNDGQYGDLGSTKALGYRILEWSDFMNKPFTKSDLKNGDVVKCYNGNVYIINKDLSTLIGKNGYVKLSEYSAELANKIDSEWDIVAVRRPVKDYECQFTAFERSHGILVYERVEPEEMTLEQVCKLLGKEIKIIP